MLMPALVSDAGGNPIAVDRPQSKKPPMAAASYNKRAAYI